jgi:hypothetical protein
MKGTIKTLWYIPLLEADYFENFSHQWVLPILKHKVKVIMNLNIGRSRGERGVGGWGVRVLRPSCHPWALPILKHKVNIIMNMNIGRSQGEGG